MLCQSPLSPSRWKISWSHYGLNLDPTHTQHIVSNLFFHRIKSQRFAQWLGQISSKEDLNSGLSSHPILINIKKFTNKSVRRTPRQGGTMIWLEYHPGSRNPTSTPWTIFLRLILLSSRAPMSIFIPSELVCLSNQLIIAAGAIVCIDGFGNTRADCETCFGDRFGTHFS